MVRACLRMLSLGTPLELMPRGFVLGSGTVGSWLSCLSSTQMPRVPTQMPKVSVQVPRAPIQVTRVLIQVQNVPIQVSSVPIQVSSVPIQVSRVSIRVPGMPHSDDLVWHFAWVAVPVIP